VPTRSPVDDIRPPQTSAPPPEKDRCKTSRIKYVKGKGSPYSITERTVPELIPVLGSQPAGDLSHKPGGRLLLLSATFTGLPLPFT